MVRRNDFTIRCNWRRILLASALAMGADLAYIGSRFIATKEANAEEEYKQMLVDSAAMTLSTHPCLPAYTEIT